MSHSRVSTYVPHFKQSMLYKHIHEGQNHYASMGAYAVVCMQMYRTDQFRAVSKLETYKISLHLVKTSKRHKNQTYTYSEAHYIIQVQGLYVILRPKYERCSVQSAAPLSFPPCLPFPFSPPFSPSLSLLIWSHSYRALCT